MIDTHAHLWFEEFRDDLDQVLERAKTVGVEKIVVPGTNTESSQQAIALAKQYLGVIYPAVGIHPEELLETTNWELEVESIRTLVLHNREQVVAIGEIGTDASSQEMAECMKEQMKLFKTQCEMAIELGLPVIIHTRNSFAETWEVLQSLRKMPKGQFHCFSVDEQALQLVTAAGFNVSFCGNIAWSKRVAALVPLVPLDKLLLETDSPLMNPGKRNEPAEVSTLAKQIAQLRNEPVERIEQATSFNATTLYRL